MQVSHDKFCGAGKKTSHHPAGLVQLWHDPVPRASSSSKFLFSQHEFTCATASSCQRFVRSKSTSLVIHLKLSVIFSWLRTSLSTFNYKIQFWPGILDFEAISVAGHTVLSLLRSTVLSPMHKIIA